MAYFPKGFETEGVRVACGECWACIKNRTDDIVGRCLYEAVTTDWIHAYTLTYDDKKLADPVQAKSIRISDFQNFMKRLRRAGYRSRYIAAGEYGKQKGRAHFHVLLFGAGNAPDIAFQQPHQHLKQWPWGMVWADNLRRKDCDLPSAIRYVAKYLTKYLEDKRRKRAPDDFRARFFYSKVPALGAWGFENLALRYAGARLVPRDLHYSPPGALDGHRYSMYGKAQEIFFDTLTQHWPEWVHEPKTEWMQSSFEKWCRLKQRRAWEALTAEEQLEAIVDSMYTPPYRPIDWGQRIDPYSGKKWQTVWDEMNGRLSKT
jgi:hypothetical protein